MRYVVIGLMLIGGWPVAIDQAPRPTAAQPFWQLVAGSKSQGYMTVQLSRNGTYMCGHDYAIVLEEAKAHFGILLLARTSGGLKKAWRAMKMARRTMLPLTKRHDFRGVART